MSELIASQPDTPLKAFADENKRFRTTSQLDERPTERTDNRRSNILADNARTRGLFVAHGVFVPVEREQSSGAIRARPVGVRGLRTRLPSHRGSHARVMHMLEPPTALLKPTIVARVLAGGFPRTRGASA